MLKVGHVSECTRLFATEARKLGFNVLVLVPACAPLGTPVEKEFELLRCLPNTYESFLVEGTKFRYPTQVLFRVLTKVLAGKHKDKANLFIDRLHWFLFFSSENMNIWKQLDRELGFSNQDRIVFPNADHLTVRSLIKYFSKKGVFNAPIVGLRFINVLENISIPRMRTLDGFFKYLEKYKAKGLKVIVSAETEGYRAHIAQFVRDTFVCEYPSNSEVRAGSIRQLESKQVTVGSLGSARPDKGFSRLRGLVTRILAAAKNDVEVLIQEGTSPWGYEYDLTLSELRSYRQVTFLPGYMTQKELHKATQKCDVLLMPYDEKTYEFRGSAMLFEAADLHIPIMVPSNTGLGAVVRKYGLGATFTSEADVVQAFESVKRMSPRVLKDRFIEYNSQRKKNFERLLKG